MWFVDDVSKGDNSTPARSLEPFECADELLEPARRHEVRDEQVRGEMSDSLVEQLAAKPASARTGRGCAAPRPDRSQPAASCIPGLTHTRLAARTQSRSPVR